MRSSKNTADATPLDPKQWLDRHGDYLYRYALIRTRHPDHAEEVVQETLLAAWRGRHRYAGQASERSWLTAILKRKIIDRIRVKIRERSRKHQTPTDRYADQQFKSNGKWKSRPRDWFPEHPEVRELRDSIHDCLEKLPGRLREVLTLRALEERSSEEISATVGVSQSNFWVLLHRARLRMLRCLARHENRSQDDSP